MVQSYSFAIVRLAPGGVRDERINVGVAVFSDDGVDVRLPTKLDKIRVISGALEQDAVRDIARAIEERDADFLASGIGDVEARLKGIGDLGPMKLSQLGTFQASSTKDYEDRISSIFSKIVNPEIAPKVGKAKKSRLLTDIKRHLRSARILAVGSEDIRSHRVVSNYQLAEGLAADLALKNGAMHVVETVDLASDDATIRRAVSEIAVSALVLEQARITFGDENPRTRLVYNAMPSIETTAKTCLEAAAHQGTELYNWASASDQVKLLSTLTHAAVPRETAAERRRRLASGNLPRLRLA